MLVPILNAISPENVIEWLARALAARTGPLRDANQSSDNTKVDSPNNFTCEVQHHEDEVSTVCAGACIAGFRPDDAWAHFAGAMEVTTAVELLKTEGQYLWRIEPGGLVSHGVDEPVEFVLSYAVSNGANVCHVVFFGSPISAEGGGGFDYVRFGGGIRDPRLVDRKQELATNGLMPSLQEIVHVHFADVAFSGVCFANMDMGTLMAMPHEVSHLSENSHSTPRQKTPMPHLATDARIRCPPHPKT